MSTSTSCSSKPSAVCCAAERQRTSSTYCKYADYLNREHDELPNLKVDKSIATTKRFDALKVFMTMQSVDQSNCDMYDHLLEQTLEVADFDSEAWRFWAACWAVTVDCAVPCGTEQRAVSKRWAWFRQTESDVLRLEALTRGVGSTAKFAVDGKALKFTILNPCLTTSDFKSQLKNSNL